MTDGGDGSCRDDIIIPESSASGPIDGLDEEWVGLVTMATRSCDTAVTSLT